MSKLLKLSSVALCAAVLCACGSSSRTSTVATSTAHGTLAENPPFRIASLDAATFEAELTASARGAQLLQITGKPSCGVDFYYVKFWTVGGANETTESSGALTPVANVPLAAAAPLQPLRLAFYKNDLRNGAWMPSSPTLLCGGDADPTVYFSVNTLTMADFWGLLVSGGLITVLDVNGLPSGPFAALQSGFQESQAAQLAFYESAAGGGLSPAAAQQLIVEGYHASVAPFCSAAARAFFSQL